mgnify:CR=1 FL=1
MALVKYNNRSILNVTALDSIASGDMNLITTNTISSGVSSSSFTSSIDSTYDTYLFKFINIHPASDSYQLTFQGSTDGGSNYNTTITSSFSNAKHDEGDTTTGFEYVTGFDLAQGTGYQPLSHFIGNDNDQSVSGELFLFSPSNTTFVKHFIARLNTYYYTNYSMDSFVGGYFNTTSAINAIDFKISTGNIDSGVIKMYGLSKS